MIKLVVAVLIVIIAAMIIGDLFRIGETALPALVGLCLAIRSGDKIAAALTPIAVLV